MLVASAALAAIAAGCGGDDRGGPATGAETYDPEANTTMTAASITKAQFIRRMNKTCREAWVTVLDNWDEYTATQDPKLSERKRFEEAVQLSLLAGVDFHIFDNLRLLGAPRGEEREIEKIIGPFQIAVELGWKGRWRAREVAEIVPQFEQYNQRAHKYGLDDCLVSESHIAPIEA